MTIKLKKLNFIDGILLLMVFVQAVLIVVNCASVSNNINMFLFYNNYVIVALMLLSLIIRKNVNDTLIILFYVCFFVFLMGQKIFKKEKNVFLTFTRTELTDAQFFSFITILSLGIIFTYYSYCIFSYKRENRNNRNCFSTTEVDLTITKYLFYLTLPMAAYMQIKIVLAKSSMVYTDSYLVNVNIPTVVKIGYYLFVSFALIYLSLKPKRKELFVALTVLLLIEGGLQLLQGRRALFASTLFFVIWYLLKYFDVKNFNIEYLLFGSIVLLVLILVFFVVEAKRSGIENVNVFLPSIIEKLMISTGGSDSVIANTIVNKNSFPKAGINYLINPVLQNPIIVILTGKSGVSQGLEYLQNFDSFSHWISYLTQPSLYCAGYGMGSSYLAEIYLAFGNIGVTIVSVLLGLLICKLSEETFSNSVLEESIKYVLIKNLFTLPRGGLFSWFSDFTYLIIGYAIVYIVCNFIHNRNEGI